MTLKDDANEAAGGGNDENTDDVVVRQVSAVYETAPGEPDAYHLFLTREGLAQMGFDPNKSAGVVVTMPQRQFDEFGEMDGFVTMPLSPRGHGDESIMHEKSFVRASQIALFWRNGKNTRLCLYDPLLEFETTLKPEEILKLTGVKFDRILMVDQSGLQYYGYLNADYPDFMETAEQDPSVINAPGMIQ